MRVNTEIEFLIRVWLYTDLLTQQILIKHLIYPSWRTHMKLTFPKRPPCVKKKIRFMIEEEIAVVLLVGWGGTLLFQRDCQEEGHVEEIWRRWGSRLVGGRQRVLGREHTKCKCPEAGTPVCLEQQGSQWAWSTVSEGQRGRWQSEGKWGQMCPKDLGTQEVFQVVLGVNWGASGRFWAEGRCDLVVANCFSYFFRSRRDLQLTCLRMRSKGWWMPDVMAPSSQPWQSIALIYFSWGRGGSDRISDYQPKKLPEEEVAGTVLESSCNVPSPGSRKESVLCFPQHQQLLALHIFKASHSLFLSLLLSLSFSLSVGEESLLWKGSCGQVGPIQTV